MNNENPYAGITLPDPPAGYRLAKWGEATINTDRKVLFWSSDCIWVTWLASLTTQCYDAEDATHSIFAIPLDQPSPLKSWQFREVPWVVPEPKTLADCVEETPCICVSPNKELCVVCRLAQEVFYVTEGRKPSHGSGWSPTEWKFVRYLDPPQQRQLSLDDVPDGRVILCDGDYYWRSGQWYRQSPKTGAIYFQSYPRQDFTVTGHIAEFK